MTKHPDDSLDSSITRTLLEALTAAQTEHAAAQRALRDAVCAFIDRRQTLGHSLADAVAAVRTSVTLARDKQPHDAGDIALADRQLDQMIHWCVTSRMA